tara:strand:+ start:1182 stop:1370 length:189 start_codon:yes stop_codon:yes gene_type:complete
MKSFAFIAAIFATLLGFSQDANAQETKYTLSDFELGEHVSGEKLKLSKLDGKVVVIEYWGTR